MFFLGPRPGRGSRVGHFWRDSLGGRGVYDPITARRAPTKDHQRRLADNMYWLPVDRRRRPEVERRATFRYRRKCHDPRKCTTEATTASCCSRLLTAKGRIAAAIHRITLAQAGYYLYFAVGPEDAPKLPLPWGVIWAPPNTWFSGPTRVHAPNRTAIGSAALAELMVVTTEHR